MCPYCGVGCQLTYHVKDNKILFVQGTDGPANSSRLCVKGRYGFDYVQHQHRLTKPLIRKPGVPKHKDFTVDPGQLAARCSAKRRWEEALDFAAGGLARHPRHLRQASRWPASARPRARNEEAYLFQKLVRTGFGSQQRRSLHAAVPRLERRGADGRHQLGRGVEPGARRRPRPK